MKSIRIIILSLVALFGICGSVSGQTIVSGTVRDPSTSGPLGYADIVASKGKKVLGYAVSDEQGAFILRVYEEGPCSIVISYAGRKSRSFNLKCTGEAVSLGSIGLELSTEQITEAKVSSKRLLKKESDRLVYDAGSDPEARHIDMFKFMAKIPGLKMSASSGKLEYKQKGISRILIDGKRSIVINANRQYPMEFITADHMKTIELVLPGSPEYSNKEPILLITLKKDLPFGAAAEISASGTSLKTAGASPDVVVNTTLAAIGMRYDYSFANEPELSTRIERRLFEDDPEGSATGLSKSETTSGSLSSSHKFAVDISKDFLNKKLNVIATLKTAREDLSSDKTNVSSLSARKTHETRTSPFSLNGGIKANYSFSRNNNLSLYYTHMDSASDEMQEMSSESWEGTRKNISSLKRLEDNVFVSWIFSDKSPKRRWLGSLDAGLMNRKYSESIRYWDDTDSPGLDYTQNVSYLRAMYNGNAFDRKMTYGLSARGEYFTTDGNGSFILSPSAAMSVLLGKSDFMTLGYSLFTKRPSIDRMRTFVDYSDPENLVTANSPSTTEMTHRFSFSNRYNPQSKWFKEFLVSMNYSITPGSVEYLSEVSSANISEMSLRALNSKKMLDLDCEVELRPAKEATVYLSASASHHSYNITRDLNNSFWTYEVRQSLDYRLKWFDLKESFNLRPYATSAQIESFTLRPELELSLSKYWEKLHLGASLSLRDIISNRSFVETVTRTENSIQHSFSQIQGRYVYARVFWRIGKFRKHASVNHSSFDM